MPRYRIGSRAVRALAVGAIVIGVTVPAGAASAGGNGPRRELPHLGKGLQPSHPIGRPAPWRRPPSGTVGSPLASGLNAPFGISVDRFGRLYVAEAGIGDDANPAAGQVSRFTRGVKTVLASDAPFVTDVDAGFFGDFTYTAGSTGDVVTKSARGTSTVNLAAFEAAHNPDQINTYGPKIDLAALAGSACWSTVPEGVKEVASTYTGQVDSDVFRTITLPDGSRAVADAAGNDILRIKPNGAVSVLAVLPPNLVHVTKEDVSGPLTDSGEGFPQCVLDVIPAAGFDYAFEPVPTGMAIGPDGQLYVGFLPGGEIPGAAKVVRINLWTHRIEDFVGGFSTITDIAFGHNGTLYLTELFSNDVVQVPTRRTWGGGLVAGTPSVLASVPLPNGLAIGPWGTIYVSTNSVTPVGQVVPITP
jgi:hypothetical protein